MPKGLVRYQQCGCFHFITFSCYHRLPRLGTNKARCLFERSLEIMRTRYDFVVSGYVVKPEHVHLLVGEPKKALLFRAIQALKLSVSVQSRQRPFWQPRYYDFNVNNELKRIEKLRYMHRNPVKRGLVEKPDDWLWSSFRHYASGEVGTVQIESFWTGARRDGFIDPRSQKRDLEAPKLAATLRCGRSSFRHYASGEVGTVQIESFWTGARRDGFIDPRSQKRDLGHPSLQLH